MRAKARAKAGLLPTAHHYYWDQFPNLHERTSSMLASLQTLLESFAEIVNPGVVDSPEAAHRAAQLFRAEEVDIVVIFPLGYTPAMNMLPALRDLHMPVRILNAHIDRTYNYSTADTSTYLFHEGVCCVPEFAGTLVSMGRRFHVRTGAFDDPRLQAELQSDFDGAAAASRFRSLNVGLIGQTYTHMGDMPIDEHRLLRATGKLLVRPEVEEIENAYHRVTPAQLQSMYQEFRNTYQVDESVTDEHMRFSAQTAVAFDEIIRKYDLDAFGFYWWGERDLITQLRSQSGLAVSRLTAMGRPGVTEGDVKSAVAMKILDLLGAGGMFAEFFSMDFADDFILMGHDGPGNSGMASSRPRLTHLDVHHGKSGHGLGIDFEVQPGPVTLLNLTQFDAGDTFKLIYSIAEIIPGDTLQIGNPNCRVKLRRPIHEFMEAWCQQGPSHHVAIGRGDLSEALETFAEAMKFRIARV